MPRRSSSSTIDRHLATSAYLVKGGSELASVASDAAAATSVSAVVLADLSTWLRASCAVEEFVASQAGVDAALALEDALAEVGSAGAIGDAHGATAHVDFTRHVECGPLAIESVLAPGLVDLTPL